MTINLLQCQQLDQAGPLAACRDLFALPPGIVYLDGNSLGAMPKALVPAMQHTLEQEWGAELIKSWNSAGWAQLSQRLGDRVGRLIGAAAGQVVVCDTTSTNLYKAIHAAFSLRPGRNTILTLEDNFPTDLYMIEGAISVSANGYRCKKVAQHRLLDAIDEEVGVLLLSQVNYQSGEILPMLEITRAAQACGAVVIWDLCHSAGVLPIEVDACEVDFAVGCTYKYLNAGPGAPAYIYVAKRHFKSAMQPLRGWWSHADQFAFEPGYRPADDIRRFLCGTQPVLALSAIACSLDCFDGVSLQQLRDKSIELCQMFIALVEQECADFDIKVIGDNQRERYGSQVSLRFEHGYALMQALIERGLIGDFRTPDVVRFGFAPLYIGFEDVFRAVQHLQYCLQLELWREARFQARQAVT